jgi:hypothetical protein
VRALVLCLGLLFAVAAGVFYWASGYSTGWPLSLCGVVPQLCINWQTLAYAAGVMLFACLGIELLWPQ